MKQYFINLDLTATKLLIGALYEFRFFYNHIRPHQYINDKTPTDVCNYKTITKPPKPLYYHGLNGNISGFYLLK